MAEGRADDFEQPSLDEASLDAEATLSRGATLVVAAVRATDKAGERALNPREAWRNSRRWKSP